MSTPARHATISTPPGPHIFNGDVATQLSLFNLHRER